MFFNIHNVLIMLPCRQQVFSRDVLGWVPASEGPSNARTLWLWNIDATWLRQSHQGVETPTPSAEVLSCQHPDFSPTLLLPGSPACWLPLLPPLPPPTNVQEATRA